jgi:hypothetical protein
MYETMVFWETADGPEERPVFRDYAEIWRTADESVYSRTPPAVSSARTRIGRDFRPGTIRELKSEGIRQSLAAMDREQGAEDVSREIVDAEFMSSVGEAIDVLNRSN